MKKLIALVLALVVCAFSFAALADEGDVLSRIINKGTLVIGMEGNWDPWTYHDETTGELTGIDVELGKLIAAGLGVEAKFEEAPWESLLPGVNSERFDIICNGVGYTETRAEAYNFSDPYVYTPSCLVVRGDNDSITCLEDLEGKKTCNSPGSTYAAKAEAYGATVDYVDTLGETMEQIIYGRVDATINSLESVNSYLAQHPEANIKIVLVMAGNPVACPVQLDDSDTLVAAINEILDAARKDGTLSALSIKYLGGDYTSAQ